MDIIGITISVNYDDILNYIIRQNTKFLKEWVIVTSTDDKATISLINEAKLNNITILYFDDFKRDAVFNKGGALRFGQEYIIKKYKKRKNIAVLILDSDIYLPDRFQKIITNLDIKEDTIYGCPIRHDYHKIGDFLKSINKHIDYNGEAIIGFFQLYKLSDKYKYNNSYNCSSCDNDFTGLFSNRYFIEKLSVSHLGRAFINWDGRNKTEDDIRDPPKCKSNGCQYYIHSDKTNNGGNYCCSGCVRRGIHGPLCEKNPVL